VIPINSPQLPKIRTGEWRPCEWSRAE